MPGQLHPSSYMPTNRRPIRSTAGTFRCNASIIVGTTVVFAHFLVVIIYYGSYDNNDFDRTRISLEHFIGAHGFANPNDNAEDIICATVTSERFPQHGTPEHSQVCGWALPPAARQHDKHVGANTGGADCTILVKQEDNGNEGIAHWISELTSGFLYHVQTGYRCRFYVEYTDGVDLTELLSPVPRDDVGRPDDDYVTDWRPPPNFNCTVESHCVRVNAYWKSRAEIDRAMEVLGIAKNDAAVAVVLVPEFRHIWSSTDKPYASLIANMGGTFRTKYALACAFSQLFRLAPRITHYGSNLFSKLLPSVRDPKTLVISLYIRTGRTDQVAKKEAKQRGWGAGREFGLQVEVRDKKGTHKLGPDHRRLSDRKSTGSIGPIAEGVVKCALQAEQEMVILNNDNAPSSRYQRIVWSVVGDDPSIIDVISNLWNGTAFTQRIDDMGGRSNSNQSGDAANKLSRLMLTTSSTSTHVRPRRRPTTSDFADALIDWYVLGESDAMATVTRQFSFGETAQLRNGARVQGIYAPLSPNSDECIWREWKE